MTTSNAVPATGAVTVKVMPLRTGGPRPARTRPRHPARRPRRLARRPRPLARAAAVALTVLGATLPAGGCALVPGQSSDIPYPTISPRPGIRGVSWSHFGFGVPTEWRQRGGDATYWEDASGERRLYAEVFTGCGDPRRPANPPPKLVFYDSETPLQVQQTSGFKVPGAAGGWRYELAGAGGERRTALNAWIAGCNKEIWLVISAGQSVADKIAATVVAQARK
jgi:hypothetical protein